MQTVGAYEAKTHFAQLLDAVEKGEKITITRHRVPVAMLVPRREVPRPERSRLPPAAQVVQPLHTMAITVEAGTALAALGSVMALGRAHSLTAYDATYLELAIRQSLPLATLDARLRVAATHAGVSIL